MNVRVSLQRAQRFERARQGPCPAAIWQVAPASAGAPIVATAANAGAQSAHCRAALPFGILDLQLSRYMRAEAAVRLLKGGQCRGGAPVGCIQVPMGELGNG